MNMIKDQVTHSCRGHCLVCEAVMTNVLSLQSTVESVPSIFLYACGSWTLTGELQRRIQAMEMRCYRMILHISYKDHVTNEEVCAKIQQTIRPHKDLLTIAKRRKLQRCGHVSRSSGLAKTILQVTVKEGRRRGRQRKRWEDNIREWTAWSSLSPRGQWRTGKNGGN